MKKLFAALTIFCLTIAIAWSQSPVSDNRLAYVLEIEGVISPATADYFERSLDKANPANTEFILLKMDTPGGLDLSMRKIIKKIIESPIPVVTYVSPGGSRAASAGTYILYASHVAAMAPGTNLGAATPVKLLPAMTPDKTKPIQQEGEDGEGKESDSKDKGFEIQPDDPMMKKVINDAVAYITSLAKMRGRNEEWAEKAVREATSLSSEQALQENVIDIIAGNQTDLFKQLNGRSISVLGGTKVLQTTGVIVKESLPDWRNKLLEVITNPNIAYILMLIGIYGLIFEFSNPGTIVPGTIGSICLLLALFAFQIIPINYAGLALIALGIALMVAEAFEPSFGILGLGGVVAFATGSVMLIDTALPGYGIDIGVIVGFTVTTAAFFILALGMILKARRKPIVSGHEQMIGAECEAIEDFEVEGKVHVHSEMWKAKTTKPIKKGQTARVVNMKGLIVEIEPD